MSFKEWKKYRLAEICEYKTGKLNSNAAVENGKYPFFTCSPETFRVDSYSFNQEAVLLAGNNANGIFNIKLYKGKFDAYQRTYVMSTKNKELINNKFLYYYLGLQLNYLKQLSVGSATKFLTKTILDNIIIRFPNDKCEMQNIVNILSSLDEKIETNNQINKKLEEMAQAIFKRWFVDFEFPCIPKNYKFSGSGKPCNPRGAGKPCNPRGAGKPDDYDKVLTYNRVGGLPVPDGKSWFVYVLLCDDGSFYKGMTKDLYRRFYEHYTGIGAEWTKIHKPVKVIHYEKFNSQQEARKREEELKSGYGREWIKREYKKYQEGLPAHKVKEGLPAHEVKEGLLAHEMKAGSPAHQTHLMIAGEMVQSELGMIPKGWEVGMLGDIIEISSGKRPSKKSTEIGGEFIIPLVGASTIMGYVEGYNYNEPILVIGRVGTHGVIQRFNSKVWASDNTLVIKSKYYEYTNQILKTIDYSSLNRGSTQPLITQTDIKNQKVVIPVCDKLLDFEKLVGSLYILVNNNLIENDNLIKLRDTLLPKLMSGEI
ncbi:restriction endonuclease subunit S, partial [Clostridium cochlearium]|uniref:restriction endonuclease subunit S n=1 Tax=Clostridium cochlearium TaxID=1494 RepID=UPI00241DE246